MPRRTQEDSQATRRKILESAQRLFTRRGYERTSLSDIAKYAGVTRGAIYWHFENKEETVLFDYNWCNINRYDVQSLQLISYSEDELVFAGSVWQGSGSYYYRRRKAWLLSWKDGCQQWNCPPDDR